MTEERLPGQALDDLARKRVFIETYGCRYNFGSTAKLIEILKMKRCTISGSPEGADVVIINTCSVVARTERRMLHRLSVFRDYPLYVTGCMPEVQRDSILAVCSPKFISDADIQEQYRSVATVAPDPVGIVQIARGCLGSCSYCIAHQARGPLKSVPLSEILDQVTAYANAGAAEIQLTAQDVSAWGRDCNLKLPDLLLALGDIRGNFRVRVGMMNPATVIDILDDLIDAFSSEKTFKFIHLPAQSGSDRILQRMGRGYFCGDFEQIVESFRKRYPEISIATDMIAGFSDEQLEDHLLSIDFLRRICFNKVNVTRYSRRPWTKAFSLTDTPDSEKKERSRSLQACAEEISVALHARHIHTILPFVVTEHIRRGSVMARTPSYLGIVLPEDLPIGYSGSAEILEARPYFLKGKCVRDSDIR